MPGATSPPVIIVGAPRSGTNMLRDVLTELPGFGTWPCDEINYIWRHGNLHQPSDRFTPDMATPGVATYLRRQFERLARRNGLSTVVEKTCANSLRVGFINAVFPDARYVFIYRNGVDAAASATRRWTAQVELGYLARKARWVPPADLPHYGWRFVKNRVHKVRSDEQRLAFWGPNLDDMQRILDRHPLDEVCALQWAACVDTALDDLVPIGSDRVHHIKYENLAIDPSGTLNDLWRFIGTKPSHDELTPAIDAISPRSVGKGTQDLGPEAAKRLAALVAGTLERLGYQR